MPLIFNKSTALTESEVKYIYENVYSNRQAAEFCGVSLNCWNMWAKKYIDESTGLTYLELLKQKYKLNREGRSVKKHFTDERKRSTDKTLFNILEGDGYYKNLDIFKQRLFKESILEEKCSHCNYDERRLTDYSVPLILVFEDGDQTNQRINNFKVLCFNCYYILWDEMSRKELNLRTYIKLK